MIQKRVVLSFVGAMLLFNAGLYEVLLKAWCIFPAFVGYILVLIARESDREDKKC